MLNGREDFRFPYEESQLPMFRQLGAKEKAHVLGEDELTLRSSVATLPRWRTAYSPALCQTINSVSKRSALTSRTRSLAIPSMPGVATV